MICFMQNSTGLTREEIISFNFGVDLSWPYKMQMDVVQYLKLMWRWAEGHNNIVMVTLYASCIEYIIIFTKDKYWLDNIVTWSLKTGRAEPE